MHRPPGAIFAIFAIFHTPQGTHEVWKIAKKPNPLDSGDGDIDGEGEKFFMGKCCENEMA